MAPNLAQVPNLSAPPTLARVHLRDAFPSSTLAAWHEQTTGRELATKGAWRAALPDIERELGAELTAFRRRMRLAQVPVDHLNRDLPSTKRAGAWSIGGISRPDHDCGYTLYVRRSCDQLAVHEHGGNLRLLLANFSTAFAGAPPSVAEVRAALAATLARHDAVPDDTLGTADEAKQLSRRSSIQSVLWPAQRRRTPA